ncbi:MAG: hypothetical protein FWE23_11520, partial [Chitinivibrionia bacterium]|nr:hypothetical protein [Chitinivibrionia bacterium]
GIFLGVSVVVVKGKEKLEKGGKKNQEKFPPPPPHKSLYFRHLRKLQGKFLRFCFQCKNWFFNIFLFYFNFAAKVRQKGFIL